jgi:hypothetical protein
VQGATLTRSAPGTGLPARLRAVPASPWARISFGALVVLTAVGSVVYRTYPNYDSYYSLIWGRELLHGSKPSFEAYRAPTEHPLAVLFGALLSLFGEVGGRLLVLCTLASFLVLVWGVYRLGRVAFTPLVGFIAAALLVTRFDFPFLAARGYVDIPYMALVVWAAALEAERRRRGAPVLWLLALAGLLRPEAWVLAGVYWLWVAWGATWRQRFGFAAIAAAAPLLWCLMDWWATGDPLFSLHSTSGLAEELGRQRSLSDIPSALPLFFERLVKLPVVLAALLGMVVAAVLAPRRAVMPFLLLLTAVGTFVLVGLAGLSVIERYLIIGALALMIFAAVALGGFTMLQPSRWRTGWMIASLLVVLGGVAYTAPHVSIVRLESELRFRGESHDDLVAALDSPAAQRAIRCGTFTVPNHKLIPDVRWALNLPEDRVLARSQRDDAGWGLRGGALYVTGRTAVFRQAYSNAATVDDPLIQVPGPGMRRVAGSPSYAIYEHC